MRNVTAPILSITLGFFLFGCSLEKLPDPDSSKEASTSNVEAQKQESQTSQNYQVSSVPLKDTPKKSVKAPVFDEVQLIWQIPKDPVEKYLIYFGFTQDKLDHKIEVAAKSLDKVDDKRYGPVYRYYLSNIPVNKTVYVSIGAMRGDQISTMGEIVELKPESTSGDRPKN